MNYLERARKVISIEIEEVRKVAERLDENFVRAVDLIRNAVSNKGKVVLLGVGKSGHIAEKIAATLTSTGTTAVVLNSQNAMHGDLGILADGDVVLAFSYSGETEELINMLPALLRFDIRLIAITGGLKSSLAKVSAAVLDVSVSQEACPLNLAPTSSTTAMLVLGDALAMALLEANGFSSEDFAKFHPGGRLGRTLLLRVKDIMRTKEQMALVAPSLSVLEVIRKMTSARCGCAVVIDPSGALIGIFTHGDFVRHFPQHPDIGQHLVQELMTPHPITISGEKLAAEVLHVLKTHRIDDLVVVDDDNHPIGLIDSQDLTRLKII